jgi:tagaturonate reductase
METITSPEKLSRKLVAHRAYPEKVIQFGTGVLLRGLVDHVIEMANNQQNFAGSIVQIKSTEKGSTDDFDEQDNVYTVAQRGIKDGHLMQSYTINSSISRTLVANKQWSDVLQLASNPSLSIIVSNTTEAGIELNEKDFGGSGVPLSFPGKLLHLLYERFLIFEGDAQMGYTIIPTELISNNGQELRRIVLLLANRVYGNTLFNDWILSANNFCNSLVDRIVTGIPPADRLAAHWEKLGYQDKLLIECEPYLLWAIEGSSEVQQKLGFANAKEGVVISTSIERFKELKLRLLNGTHSFICGMAFLKGFTNVRDTLKNDNLRNFLVNMMQTEICPTLPYNDAEVSLYAKDVADRFANPFIDHKWLSISFNYTQKMRFRNLESIERFFQQHGILPPMMCEAFAWFLHFSKPVMQNENGEWLGDRFGEKYVLNDVAAPVFFALHQQYSGKMLIDKILSNDTLWGQFDFGKWPGFSDFIYDSYAAIGREYNLVV